MEAAPCPSPVGAMQEKPEQWNERRYLHGVHRWTNSLDWEVRAIGACIVSPCLAREVPGEVVLKFGPLGWAILAWCRAGGVEVNQAVDWIANLLQMPKPDVEQAMHLALDAVPEPDISRIESEYLRATTERDRIAALRMKTCLTPAELLEEAISEAMDG